MKLRAGDRVRTPAGLEGEILFVDAAGQSACVELDGSVDDQTEVYRLNELTKIKKDDKKHNP